MLANLANYKLLNISLGENKLLLKRIFCLIEVVILLFGGGGICLSQPADVNYFSLIISLKLHRRSL